MSGTFVIVEGADGSGKTTLAETIASTYGVEYEHVGPPREDMTPFAEHVEYALLLADEYGQVVFDRFHLGCFCYGPIFRPENDVDGIGDFRRADWDLFERLIRDRCLLVLCDPGWDVVEENVQGRDGSQPHSEYERDLTDVRSVYKRFHKGFEFSGLPKTTYDYTTRDAWKNLAQEIEGVLEWSPTSVLTT